MDAGRLHAIDRADRTCELALHGAQVIDVLDEAGGAQGIGFVEDFVADAAALRQAALGEPHAHARHLVARHHDDGAFVLEFVGDALPLEVFNDRGGILDREVGEQRRHLRGGHPQDEKAEHADERHGDGRHGAKPRRSQRPQEPDQSLHRRAPDPRRAAPAGQNLPGAWFPFG
jgi:hypothetical protein